MKKISIAIFLTVLVTAVVLYGQLDSIVETGISTGGTEHLSVDVAVDGVSLSPLSGKVSVSNLKIGQPQGFGEGPMLALGEFMMKLETASIFSDHIIIDQLLIDAPLLDVRRQDGKTNFKVFQEGLNLQEDEGDTSPDITITIRELMVRAPRVLAKNDGFLALDEDITLADFTLTNLGTDEKGLAPKEIARHIMDTLQPQITKALIAAGASNKLKDIAGDAKGKLEQGLGGLLGKLKKKKTTDPDQ